MIRKLKAARKGVVLIVLTIFILSALACPGLPGGLVFIGLVNDKWSIYMTSKTSELKVVSTSLEPNTPALSFDLANLVYADNQGNIYEIDLSTDSENIILATSDHAYAQPTYSKQGALYAVQLINGNSADTDIVQLNRSSGEPISIIKQRSVQFNPYVQDSIIYYENIHCLIDCGHIIQEIWMKNIVSGEARQMTFNHHITRQPVVDDKQKKLYYSGNQRGHYHIYEHNLDDEQVTQVTKGPYTDLSPAISSNGFLYFIRHSSTESQIMCRNENEDIIQIDLTDEITSIRDLEIIQ